MTLKELIVYSKRSGLNCVAVTDHDTIEGALKLVKQDEILVIPGVEVSAKGCHVLALNVMEPIQSGLGAQEVVERVHEAGGIAALAHPTAAYKGARKTLTAKFDAIEVINSSSLFFDLSTYLNGRIADALGASQLAGSDAHYAQEVGYAYTIVEASLNVDEIVKAVKMGLTTPCGRRIPWGVRLKREALSLKKKIALGLNGLTASSSTEGEGPSFYGCSFC